MTVKKISKDAFKQFVDGLIKQQKVMGPCAKGDRFEFEQLDSSSQLRLDYDVTLRPPNRKYFLPPVETLLTCEIGGGYQSVYDDAEFILLGIHPYDLVALNQMDQIFSQDNYDTHYMKRRLAATIIACDVVTASKDVFAASMGTATVKSGFDVLLTDIGDSYLMETGSPKGEKLIEKAKGAVDAAGGDLEKRQTLWKENQSRLNNHKLKCDSSYLPELLEGAYDHPVWEEKAKTCFSCGSCNQVCPTCYCFNVQDDVSWDFTKGTRQRAWDGCLLDGFTKVAGEHEFRKKREDRFRHRLYRKGKYVPEKLGTKTPACVGCGRCVSACLPDIANPVNIYNRLVDDLGLK
ncbi:MAG: 4Fe-4S dicluster domain-containing protein [Phycisphaerae bacterium]|jgi:formate hydrogenlyase subunit 6/NADH:ubiquinone oxidoreductase subunit I